MSGEHGRDLVTDALAAARRQHGERIAARQHLADHFRLTSSEIGMAEGVAQHLAGGVEGGERNRVHRSFLTERAP
jgi:hypothetical protein